MNTEHMAEKIRTLLGQAIPSTRMSPPSNNKFGIHRVSNKARFVVTDPDTGLRFVVTVAEDE